MATPRCPKCMTPGEAVPCPRCGFDYRTHPQPEYALPYRFLLKDRYRVGKVLGQGGFGITYVGWDEMLDQKVAIKEYYPSGQVMRSSSNMGTSLLWNTTAQAAELRKNGMDSFIREAQKMARVRDIREVVHVTDIFYANDTAYIVMDYVEGQTLKTLLERRGTLSWQDGGPIFLRAISAMDQVHAKGMIHRDLSPDNLMIQPDGSVRILDLGAAKDLSVNSGASSMLVAKGGFSPLEQYTQRGSSGPHSDVYAMAATMYYSFTGVMPPPAMDRVEQDGLRWDLPQLRALPPQVLNALRQAMTLLAKDRTQTMAQFHQQLTSTGYGYQQPVYQQPAYQQQAYQQPAYQMPQQPVYARNVPQVNTAGRKKTNVGLIAGIAAAVVVVLGLAIAIPLLSGNDKQVSRHDTPSTVEQPHVQAPISGQTPAIQPSTQPDTQAPAAIEESELWHDWFSMQYDSEEEARKLLTEIGAYEEEIALMDLTQLTYCQYLYLREDGTYAYAFAKYATRECTRDFYALFVDTLYENRTQLESVYNASFAGMSRTEFQLYYAQLYGCNDYEEFLDTLADSAYDYAVLAQPWETGTYYVDGDRIYMTEDGDTQALYVNFTLVDDELTLYYTDITEVYIIGD